MSTQEREKIGPTADAIVEKRLAEVAAAAQDVQREAAPELAEKRLEAMPTALTDEDTAVREARANAGLPAAPVQASSSAATSQALASHGISANSDVPSFGADNRAPAVTGVSVNADVPSFREPARIPRRSSPADNKLCRLCPRRLRRSAPASNPSCPRPCRSSPRRRFKRTEPACPTCHRSPSIPSSPNTGSAGASERCYNLSTTPYGDSKCPPPN